MNHAAIIRAQAAQIETLTAENRMLRAEYDRLFEYRKEQLEREHEQSNGIAYCGKRTSLKRTRVVATSVQTGARREFGSIKEAAKTFRVPYTTLYCWLDRVVPKRQHIFERA
jgi:hypothetical protein